MSALPGDRVTWWIEDDGRQLTGDEQKKIMGVIGLKENDMPEVLVHDFRANGYLPEILLNFLGASWLEPGRG